MTVDQFIAREMAKLNNLEKLIYKPFEQAVRNTLAKQTTRIFVNGKNSADGLIGKYSTSPAMYINPKKSPGDASAGLNPTVGITGKHKFKNGEVHKTTYVKSYKEYRRKIGRKVDKVNLDLSHDLKFDFSNSKTPGIANPKKISSIEYVTFLKRDINEKKREGMEDKYGIIFNLTKVERENFYKTLNFNFRKALIDG